MAPRVTHRAKPAVAGRVRAAVSFHSGRTSGLRAPSGLERSPCRSFRAKRLLAFVLAFKLTCS